MLTDTQLDDLKTGMESGTPFALIMAEMNIERKDGNFRNIQKQFRDHFGDDVLRNIKKILAKERGKDWEIRISNAGTIEKIDLIITQLNLIMASAHDKRATLSE